MHALAIGIGLGTWPDWVAAAFTSLAFLVAAVSYAHSVHSRRQAQARLVYAKLAHVSYHQPGEIIPSDSAAIVVNGEGYEFVKFEIWNVGEPPTGLRVLQPLVRTVIVVHNGSDELIGPVKIQLLDPATRKLFERVSLPLNAPIEPRSDLVVELLVVNDLHPGAPSVAPVIWFRDSSSRWWRRDGLEPIEAIHDDPHNMADTERERAIRDRDLLLAGGEGLPGDPRLSARVRWHRFWRGARGRSPIP
ncbi:hypothetical protein QL996_00130 [Planococcus sp. APC 4015]|nr:hypothetical protein [Planococcus sp. APC 4015]